MWWSGSGDGAGGKWLVPSGKWSAHWLDSTPFIPLAMYIGLQGHNGLILIIHCYLLLVLTWLTWIPPLNSPSYSTSWPDNIPLENPRPCHDLLPCWNGRQCQYAILVWVQINWASRYFNLSTRCPPGRGLVWLLINVRSIALIIVSLNPFRTSYSWSFQTALWHQILYHVGCSSKYPTCNHQGLPWRTVGN